MPLCDGGAIRLYELGLKVGAEPGLERDMPEGVATGVGCIVSIDASEEGDSGALSPGETGDGGTMRSAGVRAGPSARRDDDDAEVDEVG